MIKRTFLFVLVIACFFGCALGIKTLLYHEQKGADFTIKEGILCTTAQRIKYEREGKRVAIIDLSEPVMVAQSDREEQWGYFQFPAIGQADDGTLIVTWQMKEDSIGAIGVSSKREFAPMMSKNRGKTWEPIDKSYKTKFRAYNVFFSNGDNLQITTPRAKNIYSYTRFPKSVSVHGNYSYYKEEELPKDLRGVYLTYEGLDRNSKTIHAKLIDPGLLRYAIDGLMPIIWWGNIKELADHSLVAGVYPCYYLDEKGSVLPGGVTFYRSYNKGESWERIGRIFYTTPIEGYKYSSKANNEGFTEPAFDILKDSSFVCIMRTGSSSPLFQSKSKDRGKTWSTPVPITPNGVKPSLLLLNNGVLVLASGRPGIQLRFSFDGKGDEWSTPIDLVPFISKDGKCELFTTCGYASIIEADDSSFYIVYSDFTTENAKGEKRKTIYFRKVTITTKI